MARRVQNVRLIKMIKIYCTINEISQQRLAEECNIIKGTLQNMLRYNTSSEENLLKLISWSIEQETKPQEPNR